MKIVKKFSINGIAMRLEDDATELKKELWTIDELEDASGLSKRTIKYYVQLGLISPAIGETRSARYSVSHLNEIEFIRNLQNKGYTLKQIQEMNFECAMVIRNGARAELALNRLERIRELCRCEAGYLETGDGTAGLAVSCRLTAALYLSECLMKAILLRKESRGSHYRWDYPEKKENLSKRILSVWDDGVRTGWE